MTVRCDEAKEYIKKFEKDLKQSNFDNLFAGEFQDLGVFVRQDIVDLI